MRWSSTATSTRATAPPTSSAPSPTPSRSRCTARATYLAGADPWEGDRLGHLSLTKAGLRTRDALVLDRLRATGAPVCVVLAGGYAEDVRDTVEINLATAAAVAARHGGEGNRTPT